jgi:hypothetical protein
MQNSSAVRTARRLKTSCIPLPAAQQTDPLEENIQLVDFMMLQARANIGAILLCLLAGFAEDPETLPGTIAYLQSRL